MFVVTLNGTIPSTVMMPAHVVALELGQDYDGR